MSQEPHQANWLLEKRLIKPIGNRGFLRPKSVIGRDQRQPCPDVTINPFRWICQIEATGWLRSGAMATAYGTGFLIGRRTILTAAHNFFVDERQVANRNIRIGLAVDGDRSRPVLGGYIVAEVAIPNSYDPSTLLSDWDIAVVALRAPYPADQIANLGSQPWAEMSASRLLYQEAFLSGYPVDRPHTTPPTEPANAIQYWHFEQITDTTARELFYAIDTTSGQSGSPIIVQLPIESGGLETVAVGVHTNAASGQLPNRGLAIEGPIADFIRDQHQRFERFQIG